MAQSLSQSFDTETSLRALVSILGREEGMERERERDRDREIPSALHPIQENQGMTLNHKLPRP